MVGDEVVLKLDVESLMKRYRDGLLGAQAVMLVRKVGDDILAWQEAELSRKRMARGQAPRRDDEDRDDADEHDEDDREDEPDRDEDEGRDDEDEGRNDAGGRRHHDDEEEEASGAHPVVRTSSSAPPSARAWARKSDRPSRGRAEGSKKPSDSKDDDELDDSGREVLNRWTFEEESVPSEQPRSKANDWDETSDISTVWKDKSGVATVSKRLRREEDDIDSSRVIEDRLGPAPKSERPPSVREVPVSSSVAPPSVRPSTRPASAPPPPTALSPSMLAKIAAFVVVVSVIGVGVMKGWFSTHRDESVSGTFKSTHLHLSLRFKDAWKHVATFDTGLVDADGWDRRESFFYQGDSATDFQRTLSITTFERATPPSETDLRALAASRLVADAMLRNCVPLVDGRQGSRCESVSPGNLPTLEEYFILGQRVVFARGVVSPRSVEKGATMARTFDALDDVLHSIAPDDPR